MLRRKSVQYGALVVMVLLVAMFSLHYVSSAPSSTADPLPGVNLQQTPAPNFSLTAQDGNRISLADFRGKLVVLTFIDGHCEDVCPLLVGKLARVEQRLDDAGVTFVGVSVNPWQDHVGEPAEILAKPDAEKPHNWYFLTGTLQALQPVWNAYYISVEAPHDARVPAGMALVHAASGPVHTEGFYVIDSHGRELRYFGGDTTADQLFEYLRQVTR